MYKEVFNGAPFFDDWTDESALREVTKQALQKGYTNQFLSINGDLWAFAWGFNLPEKDSDRVAYENISSKVSELGYNPNTSFYLSEVGLKDSFRGRGLGPVLVSCLDDKLGEYDSVVFRTINPAMLSVGKKVWGEPISTFSEDSIYEGGKVYVFRR